MDIHSGGVKIIIPSSPNPDQPDKSDEPSEIPRSSLPPLLVTKPKIMYEITEDIFLQYFSESNIENVELVSYSGVSGIVLSVTLKETPFRSSYINEDESLSKSNDFLNPGTGKLYHKVILKYCIIHSGELLDPLKYKLKYNGKNVTKLSVSKTEFDDEYEVQKEIFKSTMVSSGNPTCPDPFGKFIFGNHKYQEVKPQLSSKLISAAKQITDIIKPSILGTGLSMYSIGIIVMESLQDNFLTLHGCMSLVYSVTDNPSLRLSLDDSKKEVFDLLKTYIGNDPSSKNKQRYIISKLCQLSASVFVTTSWKSGILSYDAHRNNFLVDLDLLKRIISNCSIMPITCLVTQPNDVKLIDLGRTFKVFSIDSVEQGKSDLYISSCIEVFLNSYKKSDAIILCQKFAIFFGFPYESTISIQENTQKTISFFMTELNELRNFVSLDTEKLGKQLYSSENQVEITISPVSMVIDSGMMMLHRIFMLLFFFDFFINFYIYSDSIKTAQCSHLFSYIFTENINIKFIKFILDYKPRKNLQDFIQEQTSDTIKKDIIIFYKNMKEFVKMLMELKSERGRHNEEEIRSLLTTLGNIPTLRGTTRPETEITEMNKALENFVSGYGGPLPPLKLPPLLNSKSFLPPPISSIPRAVDAASALSTLPGKVSGPRTSLKPLPPGTPRLSALPRISELPTSGGSYKKRKIKYKYGNKNKTKKNKLNRRYNKKRKISSKVVSAIKYKKVKKTRKNKKLQ